MVVFGGGVKCWRKAGRCPVGQMSCSQSGSERGLMSVACTAMTIETATVIDKRLH